MVYNTIKNLGDYAIKGKMCGKNSPAYGRKLTEEHKKKLSQFHKGKKQSKETIKKRFQTRKGYKHSEETKKKISKANKGKKREKQVIIRHKKIMKKLYLEGKLLPSKTSFKKGNIPWNKGKKGYKLNRTVGVSEETKDKLRKARLKQKNLMIDTSIEIKIKKQLEKLKIKFIHPFNLANKFQCDFYIPKYNLIIEADGDYWHNLPNMKKRDRVKNAYAKKEGYLMLRIWEHEINNKNFSTMTFIRNFINNKNKEVQNEIN